MADVIPRCVKSLTSWLSTLILRAETSALESEDQAVVVASAYSYRPADEPTLCRANGVAMLLAATVRTATKIDAKAPDDGNVAALSLPRRLPRGPPRAH